MTVASATACFTTTALPSLSFVWRCRNQRCRKIILELEWNGLPMRHRCDCNEWTKLPEHAEASLRTDRRKW